MLDLKIATFNTHGGLDVAGCPFDLDTVIAGLDADVIALQECWFPVASASQVSLPARFESYELVKSPFLGSPSGGIWDDITSRTGTRGHIGVALLSRYPIVKSSTLPLRRVPGDLQRMILSITVDVDGTALQAHTVHACSAPYGSLWHLWHLRALGQLEQHTQRCSDPEESPAILAGDFNMWGPVVEALLPDWRRAAFAKTWPSHNPAHQIDHILVRGPIEIGPSAAAGPQGSDHRPLQVQLRL